MISSLNTRHFDIKQKRKVPLQNAVILDFSSTGCERGGYKLPLHSNPSLTPVRETVFVH